MSLSSGHSENKDILSGIEVCTFPSAVVGYQKKAVDNYVARQAEDYGKSIDSLVLEVHQKEEEIRNLQEKVSALKQQLSEAGRCVNEGGDSFLKLLDSLRLEFEDRLDDCNRILEQKAP